MFRQSPSRTQRSRGFKAKHVLQICFLLAICFWLLYQVKHSHDKKKEFDEGDVEISQQTQGGGEILKLGRKDLNPRVEDTTTSARSQDEEAEEDNAGEEEEIKLEEENAEDKKSEEKGDEQGGVGDDDIDENEEDKSDAEVDREVDVIEEEKENEEKDSEDNDGGQLDNESAPDEHDDDEQQAHEAREEHYRADDASSAVTHETEVVDAETENGNTKKSSELAGTNIVEKEQVVNNTNENTVGEQTSESKVEDQKMTEEGDPIKTTDNKNMENVGSKSDDSSDDHLKLINNTTVTSSVTHSLSMTNGTEKESDFRLAENVTTEGTTSGDGSGLHTIAPGLGSNSSLSSAENQADLNMKTSTKVEDADLNSKEVPKTENSILSILPEQLVNSSNETEDSSGGSSATNNDNAAEGAKSEDGSNNDNAAEGTESEDSTNEGTDGENDGALETENSDEVQHDLIDSSDSSIGLEEKEVRTDLENFAGNTD